jgi:signal transduction histidine kinase
MQSESEVQGIGKPTEAAEVTAGEPRPNAAAPDDTVEALRRVQIFTDLPEEQLRWFVGQSRERRLEEGDVLFHKGDPADWMTIYLEGETHARRTENHLDDFVYIARAGDPQTEVTGKLPFSRMKEYSATGRAVTKTRVLSFPVKLFPELSQRMPQLYERLVWNLSDRVREFTRASEQQDKLMSLGKLSAGLAHELNNPAAAARRAANELLDTLEHLRAADLALCRHHLTPVQRTRIAEFEQAAIRRCEADEPMDALARSDREDELNGWLDRHNVENVWDVSHTLVEAGVDEAALEQLRGEVGNEALGDVLARVGAQLQTMKLVCDIGTSTSRISELVAAIKEYSYMDTAAVGDVDVHKGLDNTLVILKHKLKKKNITVVREYAEGLPHIRAHGSQLNQMWTNLIDNALDAMPDGGRLKVRTQREPVDVMVEIRDNGTGIPEEARPRIFEPFFTTKPVGEGTGLGLDAVARIVRRHHGHIRFESKPGDTCFQVRLPLAPDAKVESSKTTLKEEDS